MCFALADIRNNDDNTNLEYGNVDVDITSMVNENGTGKPLFFFIIVIL